jgi:cellobiose-specific phosphotransferase system component IIA
MIRAGDDDRTKQARRALRQILEEAARAGADTIELEYANEGLEVTFMFGHAGVGDVLVNRELEREVIGLIVEEAHLQNSSRGSMGMILLGEPYTIIVEEYESFGESAFRLRLQKSSEGQT